MLSSKSVRRLMHHVIQQCTRSLALVLFLGAGLAFTSTPAAGQVDVTPGLRVGINASTAGGDAEEMGAAFTFLTTEGDTDPAVNQGSVTSRDGLMIGAFATIDFGAPVVLQPELRWIQKGYVTEYSGFLGTTLETTVKLSYIEVPIVAKYDVPAKIAGFAPYLVAGPTIGFNIGAESDFGVQGDVTGLSETTQDLNSVDRSFLNDSSLINGTEFALEFGAGASYSVRGLGTASADIRYGLGLTNYLNTDAFDSGTDASDYSLTNQVLSITLGFSL